MTKLQCLNTHNIIFSDKNTTAGTLDTNGDANSDREDVSAPVKRRRKMVLTDEEEDEEQKLPFMDLKKRETEMTLLCSKVVAVSSLNGSIKPAGK